MSTNDEKGDDQTMEMVGLAISPYQRRDMEREAKKLRKVIVQANEDFAPMKERLVEMAVMGESFKGVLKAMQLPLDTLNAIRFPSESFLAIQKLTLPKIWDFPFTSVLKTVTEATSRHQEIIKEVAAMQMNFPSMTDTTLDEWPVYMPSPPVRRDPPVTNFHVNVYIERQIVHRDGRPLVAVPEAGCIELDPYFYLCNKREEKKCRLYYFKGGKWNFEELNQLPARLLHYLYDVGFHVHTYAQKLDRIAEALDSSKGSISNRIGELNDMCDQLKIQNLLQKVGEDRWCLSRQLDCFEGSWM